VSSPIESGARSQVKAWRCFVISCSFLLL